MGYLIEQLYPLLLLGLLLGVIIGWLGFRPKDRKDRKETRL